MPADTEVRDVPAEHRYQITVAGEPAGFAAYVDHDGRRVFYHTVIDDAFGGRGLGGTLVAAALADVRATGRRFVAVCPFVASYLKRHPEVSDLADPVTPAAIAAVEAAVS